MNILFIGIFDNNEPNTALRNAFKKVSNSYAEVAWNMYSSNNELNTVISNLVRKYKPDIIFMQLQVPNVINSACLDVMKSTGAFLCQWTGDARQPLPRHYIDFGRQIDLSLFTNMDDVETMRKNGVNADYLQVSADHNIYKPEGTKIDCPEIVFMGNNYGNTFEKSAYRRQMVDFLQMTYGKRFGVYGSGWHNPAGNLMFQQEKEAEIYRSCKIAINCSHYDLKRYTSDRFFRILLSGALCLSKVFPDMEEFWPEMNFGTYNGNFELMRYSIDWWIQNKDARSIVSKRGCDYAHNNWTWDHRIHELLQIVEKWKQKN